MYTLSSWTYQHIAFWDLWSQGKWCGLEAQAVSCVVSKSSLCLTQDSPVFCHMWNLQFSSVAQLCPTLCDPMNRSTPGLPVHHHLLKFTQTHVHQVRDAIQPCHPLSSPSSPAPNPSQHQSPFQWVSLADWFVSLYLVQSLRAFTVLNTSILPVLAFLPCTAHPFSLYSFHPFIPPSTVYHLISHCSLFTQSNLILCTGK